MYTYCRLEHYSIFRCVLCTHTVGWNITLYSGVFYVHILQAGTLLYIQVCSMYTYCRLEHCSIFRCVLCTHTVGWNIALYSGVFYVHIL